MGSARLLLEIDLNEKEKKFYFNSIISGGEKMRNIIDGLLMLAKIRNQDKLKKSVVKMDEVLDSVITRMNRMILESNADVIIDTNWHDAIGNSLWIEEVWINLLSNAIKYGGNPPIIKIGSTKNNKLIKFWISDNGEGLSENEKSQLFSEFNRMHPNKESIKGHGLGLSIVQRVISKLGGDTGVDSKKGEGSTFYFTLPKA
jgi:signal transduction histidine kinase